MSRSVFCKQTSLGLGVTQVLVILGLVQRREETLLSVSQHTVSYDMGEIIAFV